MHLFGALIRATNLWERPCVASSVSHSSRHKVAPTGKSTLCGVRTRGAAAGATGCVRAVTQKDEEEFYKQLGLNDAFAVCAVGDEPEQRFDFTGRKGWGFSIADMARLGLTNTVYLGVGSYEKDSTRFRKYLVQISADECLALLK